MPTDDLPQSKSEMVLKRLILECAITRPRRFYISSEKILRENAFDKKSYDTEDSSKCNGDLNWIFFSVSLKNTEVVLTLCT